MATVASESTSPVGTATAPLRLICWGDFALRDCASGDDVTLSRRKSRALLAYLALHPGKPVSRDRITGLLWGDRGEDQARASLRQTLFELRGAAPELRKGLVATRDHIALQAGMLLLDLDDIETCAAAADYPALLAALPEPHERLFHNLDDIDEGFDDWLGIERTRRRDTLIALVADASAAALAAGRTRDARALYARLREWDETAEQPARPPVPTETIGPSSPAAPVALSARRSWLIAALAAVAVLTGAWTYFGTVQASPIPIAVLPFQNLTPGQKPYMAEGVSEELLSRLAGNKRLKVLGRTSAWSFRDQRLDAPALGRKLAVDYLVEGSVRSDGPRLRVNVALVRARDGAQLWAERFDGAIGDLFVIQDRIGDAVLARLDATAAPARARPRRTRGDVHALYLTARGLVRDREEARLDAAIDLLRQAVALDPRYAPAWASLGAVLNVRQLQFRDTPDPAVQREALGYIRRAISMEPDLAEGHYALGLALAPAASAKPHLQRAVRLDPENAEVWSLLAQLHARDGLHEEALTAWRRALDIDPLWWMAFYYAAQLSWEMGERAATIRYVQRIERDGVPYPFQAHMVRADMAWRYNDYSAGFRHARVASTVADAGKRFFADLSMGRSLRAAGLFAEARPIWRHYPMNDQTWRLWRNQPPSRDEVRAISADPEASWKELPHIHLILRTLINAGRHAEVATLFDRGFRSPEAFMAEPHVSHHEFVKTAPLFAIAFRAIGRAAEAEQLLRMADAAIARRLAQGRMARWYHADCAGVWAVQGRHDAALAALERSAALGWVYNSGYDSFADIGLEPAYAALRGNPRFERLRARFQAHVARERRELLAMGI